LRKAGYSVIFLLIILFTLNYSIIFAKGSNLIIEMDGHSISIPEGQQQSYVNKDGRSMLSLRFVAGVFGIPNDAEHIHWDQEKKMVRILHNNTLIEVNTIADNIKGNVFLPLRDIAEALGFSVVWEKELQTVHILTESNRLSQFNLANLIDGFPFTVSGDGFNLTLNDVLIYPFHSIKAKRLIDTYGLKQSNQGTPYYLVWLNVELMNSGLKEVGSDPISNESLFSFGFHPSDEDNIQPIQPKTEFDQLNNYVILYNWRLKAQERIQSHIALILTQKDIERFFVKTDKENRMLAIRQS
jgi:hypothetical protein